MRTGCAHVAFTGIILAGAADAYAATIALTAVKRNNAPIAHVNELVAAPGDTIEAEVLISEWALDLPDGIGTYGAYITGRKGCVSGSNGVVLPLGWDAPLDPFNVDLGMCLSDWDCSFDPHFSCVSPGLCLGPNYDPAQGAFITRSRPDYIFYTLGPIFGVGFSSLNYVYHGTLLEGGVLDPGTPLYGGTLILVVGEGACGTFRFSFETCSGTVLQSPSDVFVTPDVIPLVIQLPECPALPMHSDPGNCTIDARIPHVRGQPVEALTADTLLVRFDQSPANLTPASFRTRVIPEGTAPTVEGVTAQPANSLQVQLSDSIPAGSWTCLEHRASGREICLASLPGDVNADSVVNGTDIDDTVPYESPEAPNDLIEWLIAIRFEADLPRCDIDRSGRCVPLDILSQIDLMNGSGFAVWNAAELPSLCPSADALDPREPRGSCCNALTGSCFDDVLEANCVANQQWASGTPCCEVPCSAPTGACCELSTGTCTGGVFHVNCQGIEQEWTVGVSCAQTDCEAIRGACCNLDSGACGNNVLESQCQQSNTTWHPGLACNQILCAPQ